MAAEEDNFDIDIYGDGGEGYDDGDQAEEEADTQANSTQYSEQAASTASQSEPKPSKGVKRKEPDDRPLDPGATAALFIADLSWWITDDEIRGWTNESECEDELEEITFSEHKVNGKSKGQVYMLFSSPQAGTAVKRRIDSFADGQRYKQRFQANYTNPLSNPFKTLPKDASARNANRTTSNFTPNTATPSNFNQSNYRGRGGGYRGGMPSAGGYGRGGAQMGAGSGGFQSNLGYQQGGYGGYNARGGMNNPRGAPMSMRGGRGGMNMMQMPMANMPMAPMPNPMSMGMAMPQMGGAMPMHGYQNTGYYPQGGDANWNPHGAKRTRQE